MIPIRQWAAYALMTGALAAAVLLKGGVHPQQWMWSASGISAAALALTPRAGSEKQWRFSDRWGMGVMGLLLLGCDFPTGAVASQFGGAAHTRALVRRSRSKGGDESRSIGLGIHIGVTLRNLRAAVECGSCHGSVPADARNGVVVAGPDLDCRRAGRGRSVMRKCARTGAVFVLCRSRAAKPGPLLVHM